MQEPKILKDFFQKHHQPLESKLHKMFLDICGISRERTATPETPKLSAFGNAQVFDENAGEYDEWFERYPLVFESELAALRELVPTEGEGVEIGAGTGRFSLPLGIRTGVEPAPAMAVIARRRGMKIHETFAESLPFRDESFDFSLLVTVLCFVANPLGALKEIHRILKPGGLVVTAFIDRESRLGQAYLSSGSKFFQNAFLYSSREMMDLLDRAGFKCRDARQTLFSDPQTMTTPDKPKPGFGEGDFVIFSAESRK